MSRLDERADRLADDFDRRPVRTGTRVFFGVLATFIALGVVLGIVGFAAGWFNKAASVASPANVEQQYTLVTTTWEALQKSADNACMASAPVAHDSNSPVMVESPALAYVATYRNVVAKYNAAWENVFAAKLVGPPGYPTKVPVFAEAQGQTPDFCAVSAKLVELRAGL